MLDHVFSDGIIRPTIGSLQKVFEEAVSLFAHEYKQNRISGRVDNRMPRAMSDLPLPPIYVDCGNTLFDKAGEMPKVKPAFLNFLIALKDGGYDVRLMSHEPLRYLGHLHEELRARGLSDRFFQDKTGMTILRKEIAADNTKGLILIDNDVFSVPIKIKRRIFPNDPAFQAELMDYQDFSRAVLPESLKAHVLWEKAMQLPAPSLRSVVCP